MPEFITLCTGLMLRNKQMRLQTAACIFLLTINFATLAQGRNDGGKTYYYYDDVTQKKVKEIFHYVEILKIFPNRLTGEEYLDTIIKIKHGPYCMYYESGKLMKSGYFKQDIPDSVWIYYTEEGVIEKRELYRNGKLVE